MSGVTYRQLVTLRARLRAHLLPGGKEPARASLELGDVRERFVDEAAIFFVLLAPVERRLSRVGEMLHHVVGVVVVELLPQERETKPGAHRDPGVHFEQVDEPMRVVALDVKQRERHAVPRIAAPVNGHALFTAHKILRRQARSFDTWLLLMH